MYEKYLQAIEGARSQGASKIIGVDINESKRGKGQVFGMTDFINPKESRTSVWEMIKDVTEGLGVDYVFECTGIPSMLNEAIEASKLVNFLYILLIKQINKHIQKLTNIIFFLLISITIRELGQLL